MTTLSTTHPKLIVTPHEEDKGGPQSDREENAQKFLQQRLERMSVTVLESQPDVLCFLCQFSSKDENGHERRGASSVGEILSSNGRGREVFSIRVLFLPVGQESSSRQPEAGLYIIQYIVNKVRVYLDMW